MPVVKMPNGDNVSFPDEMPKDQIKSLILKKFPDAAGAPQAKASEQPTNGKGFSDVVGRIGKDNLMSIGLQATAAGANKVSDVVGEVGKKVLESPLSGFPQYQKAAQAGAEKIAGGIQKAVASPMGQKFMSALQSGKNEYIKLANEHPEAARDFQALVDIGKFIAGAKLGGEDAAKVLTPSGVVKGIAAPNEAKQGLILDAMHQKATSTIENIKNSGVKFKPQISQSLLKDLDTHPDLSTEGERAVRAETSAAMDALKDSLQKGDSSVRNLIGFRDKFTQIIGKSGQDGNAALKAQQLLDKTLDKLPEFKKFQKQWGQFKLGQEVSEAMQLADVSPAKSRAKFQKIVDSNYFDSFDPKTQSLLKTAAKGKASGKFLETIGILKKFNGGQKFGKFGQVIPGAEVVGAAALGHPGLAAGIAGSLAAGKGGELVQRGLGADVLKQLQQNP